VTPGTMVGPDHKVCTGCGETKPLDAFYRLRLGLGGRHAKCKPCFRTRMVMTDGYADRKRARAALYRAVKSNWIRRAKVCSACRKEALTHGHHDDYSKPLDVRWLCKPCHDKHHRGDEYGRHDDADSTRGAAANDGESRGFYGKVGC